jgi:hypothetical protein
MGLDVFLLHWEEGYSPEAHYARYIEVSERIAEEREAFIRERGYPLEYPQQNSAEHQAIDAYVAERWAQSGLEEDWDTRHSETVRLPSLLYPKHTFAIGYWRSSYNNAGLNQVMRGLTGDSLYSLLEEETDTDAPFVRVEWERLKARIEGILERWRLALNSRRAQLSVLRVFATEAPSANGAYGEEAALDAYLHEEECYLALHKQPWEKEGGACVQARGIAFCPEKPLKVRALVHGTDVAGLPALYIVYEHEGTLEWYTQALEIVQETIAYVLMQEDPERYTLLWSA